mgnify:CR=1 FL=1
MAKLRETGTSIFIAHTLLLRTVSPIAPETTVRVDARCRCSTCTNHLGAIESLPIYNLQCDSVYNHRLLWLALLASHLHQCCPRIGQPPCLWLQHFRSTLQIQARNVFDTFSNIGIVFLCTHVLSLQCLHVPLPVGTSARAHKLSDARHISRDTCVPAHWVCRIVDTWVGVDDVDVYRCTTRLDGAPRGRTKLVDVCGRQR